MMESKPYGLRAWAFRVSLAAVVLVLSAAGAAGEKKKRKLSAARASMRGDALTSSRHQRTPPVPNRLSSADRASVS